ncbi:T9SS type A sorting domain-containing protein [Cryomorpha ignava]|uniref:T9SS type A sorting domain-containing protein n=1 Tax=Cryomorpha ignava TaxID=101383 RepID=A0A7K3WLL4_9FLAO|nr:T9SS type A sorting domain-containing protein [Cryomorpha ignava]NEN22529.1 T9SS type A sorting domain-containing protein [Cryomorpha ignava]
MPNLTAHYRVLCFTDSPWDVEQDIFFSNPNPAYDTVDVYNQYDELYAKLYMDTLKVWIKRIDYIDDCYVGWPEDFTNEWELLYDFGLEVGDTAYSPYFDIGIITSIEEIQVQGQIRKKFIINEGINAYIQGIGDTRHPFYPKMYMFENNYKTCTSQLNYIGPSPIDSITFSPDCNGEILSTSHMELINFNIYPNPVSDKLHISLPAGVAISGSIYNAVGMQVLDFSFVNSQTQVDIRKLEVGTYFVKIELENGKVGINKFVKTR